MGTHVYFDGFNFYHRLFKNRHRRKRLPASYKWLDLLKLSQALAPQDQIDWIGYFTAYVKPRPSDPDQPSRQRAYLEALKTIPCLEVIPGQFLEVEKSGVPVGVPNALPVRFRTFEEKGSDVNLACRLVLHAAHGNFTRAIIVTNDGDLREPVRIVVQELGLPVDVVSPDVTINGTLRDVATSAGTLDTRVLRNCLFPPTLVNAAGHAISRPAAWV